MRVDVTHGIGDLANDLAAIPREATSDLRNIVKDAARAGNLEAKTLARRTAGRRGKLYHQAFSAETHRGTISAEYGPDSNQKQGGMSFEWGSRNQPPHRDLAKSADLIGPIFAAQVGRSLDDWLDRA